MKYLCLFLTLFILVSCDSVEADNHEEKSCIADTIYGAFEFEGYQREYIVFLPSGFEPGLPVVFNLPGYDVTAQEQFDYSAMADVADTANFVLVVPSGVENKWNSGIGGNPRFPTPDVDDVAFISALIDTIHENYSIDLERVYSCGWSNGGFMSYKLACELGERFAGIASVSGILAAEVESGCISKVGIPLAYFAGTEDPFHPYGDQFEGWLNEEETIQFWVEKNGILAQPDTTSLMDIDLEDGCTVDVITYSDPVENHDVVFYKIHGGGHTWPGSGFIIPMERYGTTCLDISASAEIWKFFNRE